MSTILFPAPVFGPVHSRRLGVSLGINLLPADGKYCSFDCIYCECGYNKENRSKSPLPTRQEVASALEKKLQEMQQEGVLPDVITFAGNGEPTIHPHFAGIIDDTIALRDRYCPAAKVSVLSNATRLNRPAVHAALEKVDNNILKLDTVDEEYIRLVDRPCGKFSLKEIIEGLKSFQGRVIIQTMFLKGLYKGVDVDNTSDRYVLPWIEVLKEIRPESIMIYTIERETPDQDLKKASPEELDRILQLLQQEGFTATASY